MDWPTDAEISAGIAVLTDEQRRELLGGAYYAVSPDSGRWGLLGENGYVGWFHTQREAEDAILKNTPAFLRHLQK